METCPPAPCAVLLAEDNPSNRDLMLAVLSMVDCEVTCVPDGARAFKAIQQGSFDIVLMDFHMPEMDGAQATEAVRQWEKDTGHRRTLIVGLTASAMPHELRRCTESGMDHTFVKPIDIAQLKSLVETACKHRPPPGASA